MEPDLARVAARWSVVVHRWSDVVRRWSEIVAAVIN
jgi:hypothetical protein